MLKQWKLAVGAALTATLVACGGGSDGGNVSTDSGTPTATQAIKTEGLWSGLTGTGLVINTLILENNEFWSVFGINQSGFLFVERFDQGKGTFNGSSFSGTGLEYYPYHSSLSDTFSSTIYPEGSLIGSTTSSFGKNSFTMSPVDSSLYVYDKAASLTEVAGSWSGNFLDGSTDSLTITTSGTVSGTNNGCSYNGTMTPRASGKNVFDVSVTFQTGNCTLSSQTATGIGISYLLTSGKRQIIVGVLDSTKAISALFFAQR
jgi:hypothetical protein